MKKLLLLSLNFILFVSAEAASRYWVSSSASNWNNTANWSATSNGSGGQSVPGSGDVAYFDGAGSKNGNCTISASLSIDGINISGYSGILLQDNGYTITISSTGYTQSSGTFTGGNGSFDLNGVFNLTGGTFTSTSGNMTVSGNWNHTTGGTFSHNNGTVLLDGYNPSSVAMVGGAETFYNLTFDKGGNNYLSINGTDDRMISTGTLTFSLGSITSGYIWAKYIEAQGNVVVLNTFGSVAEYITIKFTGTANQNFDLTNATDKIDGAITIDKSSGQVTLLSSLGMDSNRGLNLTLGTLNLNGKTITLTAANTTCSGTFILAGTGTLTNYGWDQTSSSAAFTISSTPTFGIGSGHFNQSNGTFSGGSATFDFNGNFNLTGGTFTAPSGIFTISGNWNHNTAGTFTHNNGTVTFDGANPSSVAMVGGSETFYNLKFDKGGNNYVLINGTDDRMISLGTLTFSLGSVSSGYIWNKYIEAQGNVVVLNTFGTVTEYVTIKFTGTANQNFDLTNATSSIDGTITIDKSLGQVTLLSGLLMDSNRGLNLTSGTLNLNGQTLTNTGMNTTCSGTFVIEGTGTLANYGWDQTSSSAALTISSSPTISVSSGNFNQSNGTFTGGSATLDFNGNFNLTGGTFTAGSGNLTLSGNWNHTTSGTFNHNNGTVTFDGASPKTVTMVGNSETFYNLTFDKAGFNFVYLNTANDRMISVGTLTFTAGSVSSGFTATKTLEARGDVIVGSSFGAVAEYIDLTFTGSASIQTFTFLGATDKINGNITVNKTSGKVNLGSAVTVYSTKVFTVTAGTLNCLNQVVSGPTFTLASGATLELGSTGGIASSGATGNIQTTTRTFNTGSYYVYSGINGAQVTGTGLPSTIAGLTINNSSGVTLTASETINTLFTLTSGNLTLGAFNILMASGSSLSGGSSSSFVYTGSTGFLKYNSCAASSTKTFPVGHTNSSAGYTPLVITFNTGSVTDDFSVIAVDKVTNDGARNGTAYTSTVVKAMWFITETTSGGSNVDLQFQWNGTDEASGFVRSACYMSHYTNSMWNKQGNDGSASGSNPYTFTHSGYTGTFSPFGMGGSGGPLPIKLLYFKAKKENSIGQISWATAAEINNDYFNIEKSLDNRNFKSIGKIAGAGNSEQIMNYGFTDSNLSAGLNYYRLKQTDYNGEFSYSPVEVISNTKEQGLTTPVYIYPLPATSLINIELICSKDTETPLRIINGFGVLVLEKNMSLQRGLNPIIIDINNLSSGFYVIQIPGLDDYQNTRFLIIK